ncbi:2-oxoglutarate dehydrogenase complex E2 component [Lithohypha guttulata]|uniref:dihydrolipoyllysine-residue succinyltransferase n=1 Tax=Lithohypha guttulata TaxID=1690604 RepID=A0AAN7YBH6_9EURO|nr:2-oxoglutarate dehydrogenase complex E2 component [Lithohypha guttulata]KAK5097212.1 2-oxoglutarate dehydrogenase complex E2 component [Lithohypha guttulata]
MAESISEGTLSSFSKQVGDHVEQDEEIASIETDKIDVSVNAPQAGVITEFLVGEGDTVTVGQDIAKIDAGASGGGSAEAKEEPKSPATDAQETSSQPEGQKEQPKKEDKQEIKETPPPPPPKEPEPEPKKESSPPPKKEAKKEPSKETSKQPEKKDPKESAGGPPSQSPFGKGSRDEHRVKMNRMRLRIAERLKQSQNTAASLTTFNEVDMTAIMELRKRYKDDILKQHGVKLGFMSAFARASVLAMKELPGVNASIEGPNGGDTIVYRDYVDISVAVSTPKGLVTPVLRNAESMNMVEIEQGIAELGKKASPPLYCARDGKLSIEDMAGGSFTISNGGIFGSMMGTPIINLPQTAVLGLHAIKERPMAVNGKVEIRPMMYLALTYDHRLLDGREAVTFLVLLKKYLEDPASMLLG